MSITKKDVLTTGKLADMAVSEKEAAIYEQQLEALFKWVTELSTVNTDNVKLDAPGLAAHLRSDQPKADETLAKALRDNFAAAENDCVKVKKVL